MVQLVRLHQPLGIAAARHIFEVTLMHQTIMDHGIDDSIEHDAQPNPCGRLPGIGAQNKRAADGEHRNAHHRADNPVKIVFLKDIIVRLVMVTVPTPAPAMHNIFMARPRDPLHRKDGGKNNQQNDRNAHSASLATFYRRMKCTSSRLT